MKSIFISVSMYNTIFVPSSITIYQIVGTSSVSVSNPPLFNSTFFYRYIDISPLPLPNPHFSTIPTQTITFTDTHPPTQTSTTSPPAHIHYQILLQTIVTKIHLYLILLRPFLAVDSAPRHHESSVETLEVVMYY